MMCRWSSALCAVSRLWGPLSLLASLAVGCASTTPGGPPASTSGAPPPAAPSAAPPSQAEPRAVASVGGAPVFAGEAATATPENTASLASPGEAETPPPAAAGEGPEGVSPGAQPSAEEVAAPAPEKRAAKKKPTHAALRASSLRPHASSSRPAPTPDEVSAPQHAPAPRATPAVAAKQFDGPPPSNGTAAASCGQVPAGVPALLLKNDRDGIGGSLRGKLAEGASATHVLAVCSVGNLELVAPTGFRIESDAPGLSSAKAKTFVTGAAGLQWELPVTPGKLVKFKVIRGEDAPESYRISYYLYPR
jgi:hypothetical protein